MSFARAASAPLVWAVRLYQRFISPMRPPTCRFHPTCSAYAVESLQRFGPVRGGWLAMRRIGRCNPWNLGGVDPVPSTWATRNDWKPSDFTPSPDTAAQLHSAADLPGGYAESVRSSTGEPRKTP